MHEACNRGHYKIVKVLLKAGADVHAKGLEDDTPLHDAASNGHIKVGKIEIWFETLSLQISFFSPSLKCAYLHRKCPDFYVFSFFTGLSSAVVFNQGSPECKGSTSTVQGFCQKFHKCYDCQYV